MYLTRGANVRTIRFRSWGSFVSRYCFHSASVSSWEMRFRLLGSSFIGSSGSFGRGGSWIIRTGGAEPLARLDTLRPRPPGARPHHSRPGWPRPTKGSDPSLGDPSMALRLSRPADAPDSEAPSPRQTTDRLDARAQACLAAGDLKSYRALFEQTANFEDPHRRYKARRTLIEQAFAAAPKTPSKDVPALFLTA